MTRTKRNLLIADAHPLIREGLKSILAREVDLSVYAEAGDGAELMEKAGDPEVDVLVTEAELPGDFSVDRLSDLKRRRAALRILVLSRFPEHVYGVRAIKAGADGFVSKDCLPETLVSAIRRVAAGQKYISEAVTDQLVAFFGRPLDRPLHAALSNREYQVMCMMASGKRMKDIAWELCLSVKTINTYRARILGKMALQTNADIIRYALRNRLVT